MGAISFSLDRNLLDELLRILPFELFVESGTFHGESLQTARPKFRKCISIELSPDHHAVAQARFASDKGIELICGDSGIILQQLRPRFTNVPTLFWLDAHWCAAENTAGERSQCPLIAELRAIRHLEEHSVIAIDDARFFLSPPPVPHDISGWPDLSDVLEALGQLSRNHAVVCFNDVILFLPRIKLSTIRPYLHLQGFNLLSYADKARGYDSLLDQTKTKEAELQSIHAELLKQQSIANERHETLLASHREAEHLRDHAAQLTASLKSKESALLEAHAEREKVAAVSETRGVALKAKEAALLAAHTERERLAAISEARGAALAESTVEANQLRKAVAELTVNLKAKEAALLQTHQESERLSAIAKEREIALIKSSEEGAHLRKDAADRLQLIPPLEAKILALEADGTLFRGQITQLQSDLSAKESVIQDLLRTCEERLQLINRLAFTGPRPVVNTTKVFTYHMQGPWKRLTRLMRLRLQAWLEKRNRYPLGKLIQYAPRVMERERFPSGPAPDQWPRLCIITPSYNQAAFLSRTMDSVLNQKYPNLAYGVQDGGSTDESAAIITRRIAQLTHAESSRDEGQADAIQKGFKKLYPGQKDIMAWLNSDDTLMPGSLEYVARYFAQHPEVDVVYGHRVIIDESDQEVGRWFMPKHHKNTLPWFDLVPQETLFWRARCFHQIGGMDPSFHFAMDWDLLLRFEQAGFNVRRVPYFLGCFRVHTAQKTSTRIQTLGEQEMQRLRLRTHQREVAHWEIHQQLDAEIARGRMVAMRHKYGIRW